MMNEKAIDDWRSLRVGDWVRFVRMPSGVDEAGYTFHRDTRRLYKLLIARGRASRVCKVDADGLPWIRARVRRADGRVEHHLLAIDDDSSVRVRSRGAG